jgi:hypothetical protein
MRRAWTWTESATSAAAVIVLMLALVSFDGRVREQLEVRPQITDLAATIVQAVRDQSLAHAPLVIFVFAAVVLVTFMLRT